MQDLDTCPDYDVSLLFGIQVLSKLFSLDLLIDIASSNSNKTTPVATKRVV
jgi:hypothetical protein